MNIPDTMDKNMKLLNQVVDPKYIVVKVTKPWMYMMGNPIAYE
ncbi:hypothetical protein [Paenibacillus sp. RC67]|nr:hypothetical protein [Paenibacillus sp. RC67]